MVQVIFARTLAGELQQNFPAPARNAFVSARLNRQLNQANQLSLRYEFTDDHAEADQRDRPEQRLSEQAFGDRAYNACVGESGQT
jgi:hypothetical protein